MHRSPRQLRICSQCGKKFGKQSKLERHLLELHGATLSIPPPTTPPSPSFLLVETQLESALAEANRCFQLANPSCRLCLHKKPFKNSRDLAQHLVSKHAQQLMCAESVPLACPPTSSEVSAKPDARHKLRPAVAVSDPHKRVRVEDSTNVHHQPQAKRPKLTSPPTSSMHKSPAAPHSRLAASHSQSPLPPSAARIVSASPAADTIEPIKAAHQNPTAPLQSDAPIPADVPAAVRAEPAAQIGARSKPIDASTPVNASAVKRSKSAPLVGHTAALSSNSSSRSGTPSSGSKPPVTPKRSKAVLAPKDSIKKAPPPPDAAVAPTSAAPLQATLSFHPLRTVQKQTTLMDFSTVGIGANTRKRYYTLKNS